MSDHESQSYEENTELLATKDLLKQRRREAYQSAKQKRKEERLQAKAEKIAEKAAARSARDQALWSALKKGKELEE